MIDYNPRLWHSTIFRRGYVYLMMFNEIRTLNALSNVKARVIDRRFYTNRGKRGNKWYWGWLAFEHPIDKYDAMCAGLVPIFRDGEGKHDTKEVKRSNQRNVQKRGTD